MIDLSGPVIRFEQTKPALWVVYGFALLWIAGWVTVYVHNEDSIENPYFILLPIAIGIFLLPFGMPEYEMVEISQNKIYIIKSWGFKHLYLRNYMIELSTINDLHVIATKEEKWIINVTRDSYAWTSPSGCIEFNSDGNVYSFGHGFPQHFSQRLINELLDRNWIIQEQVKWDHEDIYVEYVSPPSGD